MLEMKRLRLACLLRQVDVSMATGIPLCRLSLAERGLARLSDAEERLVMEFLRRRWNALEGLSETENRGSTHE